MKILEKKRGDKTFDKISAFNFFWPFVLFIESKTNHCNSDGSCGSPWQLLASSAASAAVADVARTKTLEMKGQNSNLRLDDQSLALQDWRESANKRKKKEGVARLQTSPRQTLSRLHFFDGTRLKQCPAVLLISDATK